MLAGGDATRLPGKLALDAGGTPLLERVVRGVANGFELRISTNGAIGRALEDAYAASIVVDPVRSRGPLAGMIASMATMTSPRVFAVAGDMPWIDAAFVERLARAWTRGDEALVPACNTSEGPRLEPLAALYDRRAFLREAPAILAAGRGSLVAVVERLETRTLACEDSRLFTNINTADDYAAFLAQIEQEEAR